MRTKTIKISKENYSQVSKILPQLNEDFDIGYLKKIGEKTLEITFEEKDKNEIEKLIIKEIETLVDVSIVFNKKDKTLDNLNVALSLHKNSKWDDDDKERWLSNHSYVGIYFDHEDFEYLRKNRITMSGLVELNFTDLNLENKKEV